MTEELKYLSSSDVQLRIHKSVIRYKGDFYYAESIPSESGADRIRLLDLASGSMVMDVSANSEDIDITSPTLGWCQWKDGFASYISRAPYRRQKQGISIENLISQVPVPIHSGSLTTNNLLTKEFLNLLKQKETRFNKSLFSKNYRGVVLSPVYAFYVNRDYSSEILLYKRLTPIGSLGGEYQVELYPEYRNSLTITSLVDLGVPLKNA